MITDEDLLLAVLNSAPVVDGARREALDTSVIAPYGGSGTDAELSTLRRVRDDLQAVVRGQDAATSRLSGWLAGTALVPTVGDAGIEWELRSPPGELLAARAVLAWSRVTQELPGRLRPCANTECNLFLIDHSRPGTARWCSMATCGNRMKARAHAQRSRTPSDSTAS